MTLGGRGRGGGGPWGASILIRLQGSLESPKASDLFLVVLPGSLIKMGAEVEKGEKKVKVRGRIFPYMWGWVKRWGGVFILALDPCEHTGSTQLL